MARARNIKPGFFKNEDLAECTPWARLCFAGLWVLADRDGRLEDRPKRIKGELFPFDSVEVEPLLQELERFKFIVRYETDGIKAIQVLEFQRHQTPHYSEKPSVIKPPSNQDDSKKPVVIKRGSQPPDSLIPDSPNVLPPEDGEADASLSPALPATADLLGAEHPKAVPPCPVRQLVALFVQTVPELPHPRIELWKDSAGAASMRQRWKWLLSADAVRDDGSRYATSASEAVEWFGRYFERVAASDFLTGRSGGWSGCDLAWLMKAENFMKVVQGNYENKERARA